MLLLDGQVTNTVAIALFSLTVFLACIEKLASIGNTIAVERDWVIVISSSLSLPREELNATMRRIDLFCKLVAPLFISFIDTFTTRGAIYTVIGLNTVAALVEYLAIAHVYRAVPQLAEVRTETATAQSSEAQSVATTFWAYFASMLSPWVTYVHSPVFLASFALALLYLTVLSTGPQMSTYLLSLGFTPLDVSVMRFVSVVFELSATFAAPLLMRKIGVVRAGLWFVNEQLLCVVAAAAAFVFVRPGDGGPLGDKIRGGALIAGVALSRLGLWGFDLSVQYVVQQVCLIH